MLLPIADAGYAGRVRARPCVQGRAWNSPMPRGLSAHPTPRAHAHHTCPLLPRATAVLFSTNTTGHYIFTATAVDNLGAATTSTPSATLTVIAPSPYTGGGGGSTGSSTGTTSTMVNVTVNGGSGSGVYSPYTYHVITAADPPAGQLFDRWVAGGGYPQLGDAYNYNTTVFRCVGGCGHKRQHKHACAWVA